MLALYLLLLCAGAAIYFLSKRRLSYWKRRGIAQVEPDFPFGNLKKVFLKEITIEQVFKSAYDEFKANKLKYGGLYLMYSPMWFPVDVNLIKRILTTDFEYFDAHGFFHHDKDPLTVNLFSLDGRRWKELRAKLTPTFTSAKMRIMFDMINILGERIENKLRILYKNQEPVEIKETAACFGTDVIAATFFGFESNCLSNPDNEFRKYGRLMLKPRNVRFFLEQMFNWDFLMYLGYSFSPKEVRYFFEQLVQESMTHREKHNITRKDYLDLLIQLKNKGKIDDDGHVLGGKETGFLTFNEVVANMAMMYAAGFETSSTTTTFLMYELAKNPDIQEKARQEILKVLDGRPHTELTYEDLAKMKYCEMCITESLRRYPPAPAIPRKCTKAYTIPGTNQIIEKGTSVMMPAWAIHTDPEFYSDPLKFNPENFSPENKKSRHEYAFMGFGGGPRLCIGFRFALMQIHVTMVKFLSNYRYTLNAKTPLELNFLNNALTLTAKEPILLDIIPIN